MQEKLGQNTKNAQSWFALVVLDGGRIRNSLGGVHGVLETDVFGFELASGLFCRHGHLLGVQGGGVRPQGALVVLARRCSLAVEVVIPLKSLICHVVKRNRMSCTYWFAIK